MAVADPTPGTCEATPKAEVGSASAHQSAAVSTDNNHTTPTSNPAPGSFTAPHQLKQPQPHPEPADEPNSVTQPQQRATQLIQNPVPSSEPLRPETSEPKSPPNQAPRVSPEGSPVSSNATLARNEFLPPQPNLPSVGPPPLPQVETSEASSEATDDQPDPFARLSQPIRVSVEQRQDILWGWHKASFESINKIAYVACIITAFYLYYGLISPLLVTHRQTQLRAAKEDLTRITRQFESLKSQYRQFAQPDSSGPTGDASDMRRLQDAIIPLTASYIKNQLKDPDRDAKLRALNDLDKCMTILTELYNTYHSKRSFSAVVAPTQGIDHLPQENVRMQSKAQESSTTESDSDDPSLNLTLLKQLEDAIRTLQQFSTSTLNGELCENARTALSVNPNQFAEIRLGSNLLESFAPYSQLQKYTRMTEPLLAFEPKRGLNSYDAIRDYSGAPFAVKNISDLARLNSHLDTTIDRLSADYQSPVLSLPLINATIDRVFILTIVPLLVLGLIWILDDRIKRSARILIQLCSENPKLISTSDFNKFSPYIPPIFALKLSLGLIILVTLTFIFNALFAGHRFAAYEWLLVVCVGIISLFMIWRGIRLVRRTLQVMP